MYLSKLTFETVVSFAVLGTLLEAQMPLLHPRPPTETSDSRKTRFLQKQKLYFSNEFLSPIFPNILSSCKWVLHRRRAIGNTPLDIWQILAIELLFSSRTKPKISFFLKPTENGSQKITSLKDGKTCVIK